MRCRNVLCLTWREQQRAIFVNGSILGQTVTVRPPPRDDIMTAGSNAPSGSNPTIARKRPLGWLPSPAGQETGASRTRAGPRAAARTTWRAAQGLSWHAPRADRGGPVDVAGQGRVPYKSARPAPQKCPSVGVLARAAATGGRTCVWRADACPCAARLLHRRR